MREIIEKQLVDGKIVDIDITGYQVKEMEICDGGKESRRHTGYGMDDLKNLVRNKKQGAKNAISKPKVKQLLRSM